jgi:hypothetical protein
MDFDDLCVNNRVSLAVAQISCEFMEHLGETREPTKESFTSAIDEFTEAIRDELYRRSRNYFRGKG